MIPATSILSIHEADTAPGVETIIRNLTAFGTRHTLSIQNSSTRGIGAARDWIYREMQGFAEPSNGAMDVYFNSYIQGVASRILFPVNITNVVAQINGTDDPNRVYVVTGHYDSRRLDVNDYTGDAPGSDDDASGVAVVMEMARVCAMRRPKATMIFAAVAAEEQGLYGSDHLAKTLKAQGYNVEGHWNNVSIAIRLLCDAIHMLTKPLGHRRHRPKRPLQPHQQPHSPPLRCLNLLPQRLHRGRRPRNRHHRRLE